MQKKTNSLFLPGFRVGTNGILNSSRHMTSGKIATVGCLKECFMKRTWKIERILKIIKCSSANYSYLETFCIPPSGNHVLYHYVFKIFMREVRFNSFIWFYYISKVFFIHCQKKKNQNQTSIWLYISFIFFKIFPLYDLI